jgi:hypothetical protein
MDLTDIRLILLTCRTALPTGWKTGWTSSLGTDTPPGWISSGSRQTRSTDVSRSSLPEPVYGLLSGSCFSLEFTHDKNARPELERVLLLCVNGRIYKRLRWAGFPKDIVYTSGPLIHCRNIVLRFKVDHISSVLLQMLHHSMSSTNAAPQYRLTTSHQLCPLCLSCRDHVLKTVGKAVIEKIEG